jgi:hypothetical protein
LGELPGQAEPDWIKRKSGSLFRLGASQEQLGQASLVVFVFIPDFINIAKSILFIYFYLLSKRGPTHNFERTIEFG